MLARLYAAVLWVSCSVLVLGCGTDGVPIETDAAADAPLPPPACFAQELTATHSETCARCASGTVLCWGSGRFVDGTDGPLPPTPVARITQAGDLSGGANHVCVRQGEGQVGCWGANNLGQLGDGLGIPRFLRDGPSTVATLDDATQISAGFDHTCALRLHGSVVCWGSNESGQLGDGTTTQRDVPVAVSGLTDAVEISVGQHHSCARRATGAVVCWGNNSEGQLGDGTTTDRSVPTPVVGITDALEVAARHAMHTCARTESDEVLCWGSNLYGELGVDGAGGVTPPAAVPIAALGANLATADGHTCALLFDHTVWCWGRNREGELGDGTTVMRSMPRAVPGLTDVEELTTGLGHTCARHATGEVLCWGTNASGQLGDGTNGDQVSPTVVVGL